jgi:ribose/xylose/arabinose/galactoside ABC-type transport system permease subunit
MRFDEALGIDLRVAAVMACLMQVCVLLWWVHFQCRPNDVCCGALLFLLGCAIGLWHAFSEN